MVTARVALGGLKSPGEGHFLVVGRGWGEGLVSRGTAMTSGDRLREGRAERCSKGGNQFRGVDRGGHRGGQRVGSVGGGGVGRPCTIIASRRSCPSRASIRRGVCSTSLCRSSSRRPGGRCPLWRHRLLPHERLGSRCHLAEETLLGASVSRLAQSPTTPERRSPAVFMPASSSPPPPCPQPIAVANGRKWCGSREGMSAGLSAVETQRARSDRFIVSHESDTQSCQGRALAWPLVMAYLNAKLSVWMRVCDDARSAAKSQAMVSRR